MTTADIQALLAKRYDPKSHVLLWEVGNSTGFQCSRHADALAIGLWPSRGIELVGHEIKASRTDWLKELKDPAKADAIQRYCHRWFVVAANKTIVQPGELPKTWGLLVANGDRLKMETQAPELEPVPLSMAFLAACVRRAIERAPLQAEIQKAVLQGREEGKQATSYRVKELERQLTALQQKCKAFEEASGVRLDEPYSYHKGESIGKAVAMVLRGEHRQDEERLRTIRDIAQSIVNSIDARQVVNEVTEV